MDFVPRSFFARLRRLTRGRRFVLLRRVLAAGLLVAAVVSAARPAAPPPAVAQPAQAQAPPPDLPLTGGPGYATVPVHLADASVASLLSRGMRVDVVTVDGAEQSRKVLANLATVVDVRSPPDDGGALLSGGSKGPLVLITLPADTATEVAALSLRNPVAVTLR